MKVLIAILCLSSAAAILGQAPAQPVLADTFGRLPCDDLNGRGSALAQLIARTPGSRALVAANPKTNGKRMVAAQFREILANFEFAGLEDRVSFIVGPEQPDFRYEMWMIPLGGVSPNSEGESWTTPTYDVSKAFIFDTVDENGECPTFVPRKFAELLTDVPGSRVNIVVRHGDRNSMPSRGFAEQTVHELVKAHVPRNRIRVFYTKGSDSLTYAEIWFVPPKH